MPSSSVMELFTLAFQIVSYLLFSFLTSFSTFSYIKQAKCWNTMQVSQELDHDLIILQRLSLEDCLDCIWHSKHSIHVVN